MSAIVIDAGPGARASGLWHRRVVSIDAASAAGAAFRRFAEALDRPRDPVLLGSAVIDDVQIDRHAPGERGTAPVVESFSGVAEALRWFARTPAAVRFSLAGPARPEGDGWRIEYAYDAGEFHNGGIWFARLAEDGRIAFLSHHPFALRDAPPGGAHAHGESGHTRGG